MYFRRYTRMHLFPAMKYFSKYGLLDKRYQNFMPMFSLENPLPDTPIKRKLSKQQLKQKDIDTKLIDKLFLKYPDLKYQPISSQKYAGRKFNSFSYAYSFITQQKKLIKQGYSIEKSFEIVQSKYQKQMQRKLDQTLLSRGLAIGNRARSFLSIYQQQVEYQSRLKVLRTKRQLDKYQEKLHKLRTRIQNDQQQEKQFKNYQRIFQKIVKQNNPNENQQNTKKTVQQRNEIVKNIQKDFKNVFNQFYQRATYKDKLQGLTDEEIINQIHASPNKIKRQNKLLIQYLKKKGSITIDHIGQVRVSQNESPKLKEFLLSSPEVKIALLTEKLNYEKPSSARKNNQYLMSRRSTILRNKPDKLSTQQKQLIKYNKKLDLQIVSQSDIPNSKQVYKIFESAQQRLLRLQLKYLNMICDQQIQEYQMKKAESDQNKAQKHRKKYQQAQLTLGETIQKFRRLKYRLENKFKKSASDELIFNEHVVLNNQLDGKDVQYQQLILYLRKRSQERRLTSISQANDNRIHSYLQNQERYQYPITQGQVKKQNKE